MPAVFFKKKKKSTNQKPNPQKTNKPPQDVYGKVCFDIKFHPLQRL